MDRSFFNSSFPSGVNVNYDVDVNDAAIDDVFDAVVDADMVDMVDMVNVNQNADPTGLEEEEEDDLDEIRFRTEDHTQKFAFDYNRSSAVTDKTPELSYDAEDANNAHSVAPGEGKFPSNILNEDHWDLKTFPCLHPDGKMVCMKRGRYHCPIKITSSSVC